MSARSQGLRTTTIVLWAVLALCSFQLAYAADTLRFDIPAGRADKTLQKFASEVSRQQGIGVLFGTDAVRAYKTNRLRGEYRVIEALELMIAGTGIRYEFTNDDTITLTPPPGVKKRTQIDSVSARNQLLSEDRRSVQNESLVTIIVESKTSGAMIHQPASLTRVVPRSEIEAFAFGTVQDVLSTFPQVFGGGPTEDTRGTGLETSSNAGVGTGVNLRGLGAGSTLVLVNGLRLPVSGSEGRFADIAGLPLSVVEHIEILPDTSSSQYGADAVGGVVNFVLRDSFDGAQTEASYGAATTGSLNENRVSQIVGTRPLGFDGLLAFDFYGRDALPAADRPQARSDLTAFGGQNFDTPQSNPGTITQGTQTWAIPGGQDGRHLDATMLIPNAQNLENRYEGADILPAQQRWSLFGTGKKKVSDHVELFADALFTQRDVRNIGAAIRAPLPIPATNPFLVNPTGTGLPVFVNYNFADDLGPLEANIRVRTKAFAFGTDTHWDNGLHVKATGDFTSEHLRSSSINSLNLNALNEALADKNPETAFNPFGDGSNTNPATLEKIRGSALLTTNSHTWSGNFAVGHEFSSPLSTGGRGKFTIGADYRWQEFESNATQAGVIERSAHDIHRRVGAGFVATTLPLLGAKGDAPGPNRAELSLAARYERYSDFGSIVTPRFGLTWAPVDSFALRGTFSSSFRPPSLVDLDESTNFVTLLPVADPTAPTRQSLLLVESGKNARLQEERAQSWTVGFNLDIQPVPGLSTAVTYFNTRFTNRLNIPSASTTLLTDPTAADLITLDPSVDKRQEVCNSARFIGAPTAACMAFPIKGIADLRARNSARTLTDGIDLLTEYTRSAGGATFAKFKLEGTYIFSFSESQSALSRKRELVSTQNFPIDLRLTGSMELQRGPLRFSALATYFDNYQDLASKRKVSPWTTLDLSIGYAFAENNGTPLGGTTLALSATNVFDNDPPFQNNGSVFLGYDQENGDLMGRFLSVTLRKQW